MGNQLFAIQDQSGNYVDDRCIYYCKVDKEWRYLSFASFKNSIFLYSTYKRAEDILQNLIDMCKQAGIAKKFEIVPVVI